MALRAASGVRDDRFHEEDAVRVVVALGGNALLRRGQVMSIENQRANVRVACEHLAPIARSHELVISHGNGPQIGLLALEEAAYADAPDAPLDVLGAQTQGMIGYLIEQELGNLLPFDVPFASLLTMIEVDPSDEAFADPTKPIGPLYRAEDAEKLAAERGWEFRADGDSMRRVVPSPAPRRIFEHRPIRWLLDHGAVVICAGGGGIPTAYTGDRQLSGVEAVIDKDRASALLAREIGADVLILATDAPAAFVRYGTPAQRAIEHAHPDALLPDHRHEFAAGSMLPKVEAACEFARMTGRRAAMGALSEIDALLAGTSGTQISTDNDGVVLAARPA
jgi:carbamate kinase